MNLLWHIDIARCLPYALLSVCMFLCTTLMHVINGNVIIMCEQYVLTCSMSAWGRKSFRKEMNDSNSWFDEYLSYHDGSMECAFYKVRGKMALTQVCTCFLPQLCSALVSNSHPSDSDSGWPGTIFSHRVQFHLTGCILPLMHLTVACSLFSPLHPLSVDLAVVSTISFCTLLPSFTLSAFSFYCLLLQLSVDLCS